MKRTCLLLLLVMIAATAVSAQKNYYDETNKFGFKYPAKWKLEKPGSDLDGASVFKTAVKVSLPDKAYPGTNFYGGYAEVLVAPAGDNAECSDYPPYGYAKPTSVKWRNVKVGGKNFYRYDDVEGATGHSLSRHAFKTFHSGTCYLVSLEVGETNRSSYEHPKGIKKLNTGQVFATLETIVRNLYF